jgi:hypothetical protein
MFNSNCRSPASSPQLAAITFPKMNFLPRTQFVNAIFFGPRRAGFPTGPGTVLLDFNGESAMLAAC